MGYEPRGAGRDMVVRRGCEWREYLIADGEDGTATTRRDWWTDLKLELIVDAEQVGVLCINGGCC
jgi:hypothetical protein